MPEEAKPPYRPLRDIRDDIDRACDASISRLRWRTGKFARLIPFRMMMERKNIPSRQTFLLPVSKKRRSAISTVSDRRNATKSFCSWAVSLSGLTSLDD